MIDRESYLAGFQAGIEAKTDQICGTKWRSVKEYVLAEWGDAALTAWEEYKKKEGKG